MRKEGKVFLIILIFLIAIFFYTQKYFIDKKNAVRTDISDNIAEVIIIDKYDKMKELYDNPEAEKYVQVDIIIDGQYYNNVAIRTKGDVIYRTLEYFGLDNYSFKVKLDYVDKNQQYHGMTELHLNTTFYDPTGIREFLVYDLYNEMGIDTQNYQLGHLYINNTDRGLITIVEVINEKYVEQKYKSKNGNLYKPKPTSEIKYDGADLRYIDDNLESYKGIFDYTKTFGTTDEDKLRLVNILKNINESSETEVIEANFIDFDRIIKMVAANQVLFNVDTFTSQTLRNYFLYEENGKIDILTFDFDISMNPTINLNYWTDDINEYDLSKTDVKIYSRITEIIIENEDYNRKYKGYVQEMQEMLRNLKIEDIIEEKVSITKDFIISNEKKIYSYQDYRMNITILKEFMKLRGKDI